jgi:hypothetical protein
MPMEFWVYTCPECGLELNFEKSFYPEIPAGKCPRCLTGIKPDEPKPEEAMIPTTEQIQTAYDAITKRGPNAEETMRLSMLCARDPNLRGIVENHVLIFKTMTNSDVESPLLRASIMAVFMAGLNVGLTVTALKGPVSEH